MVTIELTDDEALVLFELLAEYGESDAGRVLGVRYAAERNALWALSAHLEKVLVAPLQPDYVGRLKAARQRLEASGGAW